MKRLATSWATNSIHNDVSFQKPDLSATIPLSKPPFSRGGPQTEMDASDRAVAFKTDLMLF